MPTSQVCLSFFDTRMSFNIRNLLGIHSDAAARTAENTGAITNIAGHPTASASGSSLASMEHMVSKPTVGAARAPLATHENAHIAKRDGQDSQLLVSDGYLGLMCLLSQTCQWPQCQALFPTVLWDLIMVTSRHVTMDVWFNVESSSSHGYGSSTADTTISHPISILHSLDIL